MAILTQAEKKAITQRITEFVAKYGDGKIGLTEDQKKERIKKVLGNESSKLKLFNDIGVKLYKLGREPLPNYISDNLENYPIDPYAIDHESRVLNIEIDNDGTLRMSGIKIDGKENNIAERGIWSLESGDDEMLARFEMKLQKDNKLKEVSDRTMNIHEENGDLDVLLEDPNIDTDEDKPMQY